MTRNLLGLSAALTLTLAAGTAMAQTYPERPITMIVPFSAGGPTDTVARLTAQAMSDDLGQQVLADLRLALARPECGELLDLRLVDVGALDAVQLRGPDRAEEHVAHPQQ